MKTRESAVDMLPLVPGGNRFVMAKYLYKLSTYGQILLDRPYQASSKVGFSRMNRLRGKKVLVTAAGQGIGRACVLAAAAEGAEVFATDVNGDSLNQLGSDSTKVHELDGTDAAATSACISQAPAFDALVHCIGYVHRGNILECDADSWRDSFRINVDSFYIAVRAVLPKMIESGGGSIVVISSVASSLKGLPQRAACGATRAAINGLVKSVAADFVGQGIRCNGIGPGTIHSASRQARSSALGEKPAVTTMRSPRSFRVGRSRGSADPRKLRRWRCI